MKVSELRKLSVEDLIGKLQEAEDEQLKTRCNLMTKQLENTALVRTGRRSISRINTIISEKKREAKQEASAG